MKDEQIKEVMRLGDVIENLAWSAGKTEQYHDEPTDYAEKLPAARAELETYLRTIGEPENTFPLNPNAASKWAHLQKHDGAEAIGVVFRTGSGSVGSLVDGRVVWADWLAHPTGSEPESVNAELLEALKGAKGALEKVIEDCGGCEHEAGVCVCAELSAICRANAAIARAESAIESNPKPVSPDLLESARAVVARWDAPTWKDLPATAEYIGRLRVAIAQADLGGALTAEEWVVKNVSGSPGLVRAMVIRAEVAESAIESSPKPATFPAMKAAFRTTRVEAGEFIMAFKFRDIEDMDRADDEWRAAMAIETPAKVSPCAGHAVQQDADEVIGLAQALEQHRARKIVDAVSALPVGGKHEDSPSPFHAGYQLACDEVMHRLLTEEWDGCLTPPGKQEADEAGGA